MTLAALCSAGHPWADGLQGTYYDQSGQARQYVTGATVIRVDPQVDFDWGAGAPAPGIGSNDFSVRWTGQVEAPASGDYTFYTQSDSEPPTLVSVANTCGRLDEVRVAFSEGVDPGTAEDASNYAIDNGVSVLSAALAADGRTAILTTSTLTDGTAYTLTVNDVQDLASQPNTIAPNSQMMFTARQGVLSDALIGTYYDQNGQQGQYFTGSTVTRIDPTVNFDWGNGAPASGIGTGDFSVRWTGRVEAPASGNFRFFTTSDDGVRLWVDGGLVIDNWTDHGPTEDSSGLISLSAGVRYDIEMEYYERGGGAVAELRWRGPGIARQIIPQSRLFHCAVPPAAVGEWRLDEEAWGGTPGEVADSNGHGLDGVAAGDAAPVPARVCNGASLDGAGDYLEIGDDPLLDITDELTVSAWVNPASIPPSGLKTIVSKDENFELHLDSTGQIFWGWQTFGGAEDSFAATRSLTTSGTPLAAGTWHHLAIVYSRSAAAQRIYVDGVQRASAGFGEQLGINTDPLQIGADQGAAGRDFDGLIDEVRVFASALSATDIATLISETRPCPANPVAYYAMDQTAWNGTPGEVADGSGNGNHGVRAGAAQTVNPGRVCRGGDIPTNDTDAAQDAVDTGVDLSGAVGPVGTIDFWYKSNRNWAGGGDRALLDASFNSHYFFLMLRDNGRLRFALEDGNGGDYSVDTGNLGFSAGQWVHIAVTWDLPGDRLEIYVDAALVANETPSTSGVLADVGTLYLGDNRSTYHPNGTGRSADGVMDEVRIYDSVLSAAQIQADRDATHPCSGLDHFAIDVGGGSASTCTPQSITITAEDAANNVIATYAGTVALSTSSGHGDWSVVAASGPAANGAADDGVASYGFVGGDSGSVVLALGNVHADDLTVTVQDGGAGVSSTSLTIGFRDDAFVITPTDPLGAEIAAGRGHGFQAALWRRDPSTGLCAVATGYVGTQNLKAWLTRDPDDPLGAAPLIGGAPLPDSMPAAPNVALDFMAGTAAFTLSTADVGKYALNLHDDASGFAQDAAGNPRPIDGGSSVLTARPFGLAVSGVQAGATPNPGADTPGGGVFTSAGSNFSATVTGVLWQAADDADDDGTPDAGANLTDNAAAQSYAWATTFAAAAPFEPATGMLGTLANGTLAQGDFAGGAATANTLQYSEVGSFTVQASAMDFLNTAGLNVSGTGGVVGRFIPFDFGVTLNAPQFATACGTFTYVGQSFVYATPPVITVTARNQAGGVTQNYTGAWWKITDAKLAADGNKTYAAATGTLDVALLPAPDPEIADTGAGTGTLTFGAGGGIGFVRAAPVAPFEAEVSLSLDVVDVDDVVYAANPAKFGDASPGNGIPFGNGRSVRWGRVVLQNAHGSERLALALPAHAEYFDGAGFVTNSDDNCSGFNPVGELTLSNDIQFNETDGDIAIAASSTRATAGNDPFAGGDANLTFSAPGAGETGFADATVDLTAGAANLPWLQFDWDGDGNHDDNPSARASFGVFQGSDVLIHVREPWN